MNDASLERIYPGTSQLQEGSGDEILRIHMERYQYAAGKLIPGLIADIACGSGYGSFFLANKIKGLRIQAVDINEPAINYARQHYSHPAISFLLGDAISFRSTEPLQTVISLETIEHLADPATFVAQLSAQLVKGGRFIASAPVTPSVDSNPYHLHDFSVRTFKKLFTSCGLVEIDSMMQVQRYKPFKLLKRKHGRTREIRRGLTGFYFRHPGKFWLRIRSLIKDGFKNKYAVVVFEKRS